MNKKPIAGYNEKRINKTVYLSMAKCRKINDALLIEPSNGMQTNVKPVTKIKEETKNGND